MGYDNKNLVWCSWCRRDIKDTYATYLEYRNEWICRYCISIKHPIGFRNIPYIKGSSGQIYSSYQEVARGEKGNIER